MEKFAILNKIKTETIQTINSITTHDLKKVQQVLLHIEQNSINEIILTNDEVECLYSQINNVGPKDRLFLETILEFIRNNDSKINKPFLTYGDVIISMNKVNGENFVYENDTEEKNDDKMFCAIERVVHVKLHRCVTIDGKETKKCKIYKMTSNNLNDYKNIDYSSVCKCISPKLEEKKEKILFEFFPIKAIIVGFINIIEEFIDSIVIKKSLNEENFLTEDDNNEEDLYIKPESFETIYNEFIYMKQICPCLENYFITQFNNFRKKYDSTFSLPDLFHDIFWDTIFHNRIICKKFIDIYIGNDNKCESIRMQLNTIIRIITDDSLCVKSKIFQALSMNDIQGDHHIDLMSKIEARKAISRDLFKNEKMLANSKAGTNKEFINNNTIIIEKNNSNINKNINSNNNSERKGSNLDDEEDLEHKTVDEVYNYINGNKEVKTKKKKRTKKRKGKKNANKIIEESNDEDEIVQQYKNEINSSMINAKKIYKIRPKFSAEWIEMIKNYVSNSK